MQAPKRMSSGRYVDLADLDVADIDLFDISQSLNTIYRFTGHWKDKKPLTVAQHTALTVDLAGKFFPNDIEVAFDCLIHDFAEAYYGDIATPLKKLHGAGIREYMHFVDDIVYEALWKLDTPFDEEIEQKRKVCDLMSLDIERRCMWKSQYGKDKWPSTPETGMTIPEKEKLFDKFQAMDIIDLEEMYRAF